MDSTASILWSLLFGSIGFGFFIYGKKQRAVIPFLSGIALCVFPYFVTNVYLMVTGGLVLISLPYFIKI